ncbi:hypothetical protein Cgig2_002975 [Carnegiea gigantea]|uniref:Uncharacterized protein n=1 Tax=Carnegiea gigantea TaxID=171969 RepID=A0A9Q1QD90_9CARY|nr:hypothetical protein Cgig2_002975 [Carnegiea gigantea]
MVSCEGVESSDSSSFLLRLPQGIRPVQNSFLPREKKMNLPMETEISLLNKESNAILERGRLFPKANDEVSILSSFLCCSCIISLSLYTCLLESSSSPSSSFKEGKFSNKFSNSHKTSPIEEGLDPLEDYVNNFESDTLHPWSPPVVISLRDFLRTNQNFLEESSSSSSCLDSYSSGKPVSYPWEVSTANPLSERFASVGVPPTNIVEESEQDLAPSSSPARSDPEDGPNSNYINSSFRDELKKIIEFKDLPPVCSSSRPHKPGLAKRVPPPKSVSPLRKMIIALESYTKSQVREQMKTPMCPERVEGTSSQPADVPSIGGMSSALLSLPPTPTEKRRPPRQLITFPGSPNHRSFEGRSSFLSTGYEGKVALLQELAPTSSPLFAGGVRVQVRGRQGFNEETSYQAQLDAANISYKKGHEAMMDLMTRVTQKYDGRKGELMPNWEIFLQWAEVIKMMDANAHAPRKEEAYLEIVRSRSSAAPTGRPASPKHARKDRPEVDAEATNADSETTEDAADDNAHP